MNSPQKRAARNAPGQTSPCRWTAIVAVLVAPAALGALVSMLWSN